MPRNSLEKERRENKEKKITLHELPYTEIEKIEDYYICLRREWHELP